MRLKKPLSKRYQQFKKDRIQKNKRAQTKKKAQINNKTIFNRLKLSKVKINNLIQQHQDRQKSFQVNMIKNSLIRS